MILAWQPRFAEADRTGEPMQSETNKKIEAINKTGRKIGDRLMRSAEARGLAMSQEDRLALITRFLGMTVNEYSELSPPEAHDAILLAIFGAPYIDAPRMITSSVLSAHAFGCDERKADIESMDGLGMAVMANCTLFKTRLAGMQSVACIIALAIEIENAEHARHMN